MRWSNKPVAEARPGNRWQPPPAPVSVVAVPEAAWNPSPVARPMLALFSVLMVLAYSRLIEKIAIPGLVLLLAVVLLIYGLFTNPGFAWARRMPTLLLAGWTMWMVPSGVFGDWPGGSAQFMLDIWPKVLVFYLLVIILGRDVSSLRHIMISFAWATAVIVVLGMTQGAEEGERLGVDVMSLSNPNDLAMYLVIGLPFCGWCALDPRGGRLQRLAMSAAFAVGLIALLRTGSRMGLLALVALLAVLFFAVGRNLKLLIAGGALVLLVVSLAFLPDVIEQRYLTIVTHNVQDEAGSHELEKAVGSAESRWELFVNSLEVAVHHPLLGVGPGNYVVANAQLGREAGERPMWKQAHNAYTQVAAECGIPGGLMFVLLVAYCVRTSRRIWRRNRGRPEGRMAFCLVLASVAFAVCAVFGSISYSIHLQLLAGMVLVLDLCLASWPAAAPAPRIRPR